MNIPDSPLGSDGQFPRPNHDDFPRLVELVLELDSQAHADSDVDGIVAGVVDPASISYMGLQRALRVQGGGMDPLLASAGLYLEAFVIGYRYRAKYGADHD